MTASPTPPPSSLKVKIALAVGLMALFLLGLQALAQIVLLRPAHQLLVESQIRTLVEQTGRSLDEKISARMLALERSAQHFPVAALSPTREAQLEAQLRERNALLSLFDDLYLFDPHGLLLADWPRVPGRRGLNMAEREYIRQVVAERRSHVSEPILGRITQQPLIILSTPILDDQGELAGIMAGVINLFKPNILGELRDVRIGSTGYFMLTHPGGQVIMHPEPERILQPLPAADAALLPPAGAHPDTRVQEISLLDRPTALVARYPMQSTPWLLTAVYPAEEAFSPVKDITRNTLSIAMVMSLLAIPLVWLLAQRFLRPLEELTRQIRHLAQQHKPGRVEAAGSTEIQELAHTFNDFMARIETAEHHIRVHEQRLSLVLETASDGIWDWDLAHNDFLGNQALAQMLGLEKQGPVATTPAQISTHLLDEERSSVRRAIIDCLKGKTDMYHSEHRLRRTDGRIIWVLERGRVVERAPDGRALRMVGSFSDITVQKHNEERIRVMAFYDALTGLPNRSLLAERTETSMQAVKEQRTQLALLFVDLDHFKNINDSLGHFTGDLVLQAVAQRLSRLAGEKGLVSRLGGDEFVVVLPHANPELAADLARRILREGGKPYQVEERQLTITPSIGISIFPDDASDFETLLRHADIAMYRAKEEGRNHFRFFTPEMNEMVCQRLELESAMREGLNKGEFFLHFQPQVSVRTGRIVGLEALVRWNNPVLGQVPPGVFIPVAEDSGLISPLGNFVLKAACAQARALQDAGLPPMVMAVNISGAQFRHPTLPTLVANTLKESGLAPEWLELELTEGVLRGCLQNKLQFAYRNREERTRWVNRDARPSSSQRIGWSCSAWRCRT
ncbi:diguanylate cyclase domain-containing protein, partial [Azovibrio restrictus]|uniref:bifunctional diguanylate cyclase/phosphodiesterase n=1 Tax=Azovibrio restrictus TaxID=146938 RepID=UPI0026E95C0A